MVALALVWAVASRERVEPERIVRVQLVPMAAEGAPGPPAPEPAAAPPPPERVATPPPARAKAPPPKPPPPKPVTPAVAAAPPVVAPPAPSDAAPSDAAQADGAASNGSAPGPVASAPPASGGGRAGAGAGGDEIAAYVARVRALLARHKEYPSIARRRGLEGTVLVRMRIDDDGRVASAKVEGGAPQLFAKSALAAVDRAGRFPAPPHGGLSIEVPIRFELDE